MENKIENYNGKTIDERVNELWDLRDENKQEYKQTIEDMWYFARSNKQTAELYEDTFAKADVAIILRKLNDKTKAEKEQIAETRENIQDTIDLDSVA